jgi:hypothetical protein
MRAGRAMGAVLLAALAASCERPLTQSVSPELVASTEPRDFGAVPVLNEKVDSFELQNVGRAGLILRAVRIKEENSVFSVKSFPEAIGSGDRAPVELAFVPREETGYQGTLVIESDDPFNELVEVPLLGKGSTRAILEVDPANLDFGRVGECKAAVKGVTLRSKGTADLIIEKIEFAEGSSPAFAFTGSVRTPATVKGQIQLSIKYSVPQGSTEPHTATVRIVSTDPDRREVLIPITGTPNRSPVAQIGALGNGAPGSTVALDGRASSDPEGDNPLTYKWTLRQKPINSTTTIAGPADALTSMRLDPTLPGLYEVQLEVTDSQGVPSCTPARATVVAAPAQKLLVELFWEHPRTDIDLHLLREPSASLFGADDVHYANKTPDWGVASDPGDNPELLRDALTGYGPEVIGYVNPIETTFRIAVEFKHAHLDPNPATPVTVRIYQYGVVKAEFKKTMEKQGDLWGVADVAWPSGTITPL